MDIDAELLNAVRDGMREGVKKKFADGYNSPLDTILKAALEQHSEAMQELVADAIAACLSDPTFRDEMAAGVRTKMAKTLVARFGGEVEKQVNALKSDPTTRARITLAIDNIVKQTA